MQVERFVNRGQTIKHFSGCFCFNKNKNIENNFQLKVITPYLKTLSTENLESSQFALERNLKKKLAELRTDKQNADTVRLGRRWKVCLFLGDALCLMGCLQLAKYLCKAGTGTPPEVHSFDMKLTLNLSFSTRKQKIALDKNIRR